MDDDSAVRREMQAAEWYRKNRADPREGVVECLPREQGLESELTSAIRGGESRTANRLVTISSPCER